MPKLLLAVKKVYVPPPAPEMMNEVQSGNSFGIGLTTYGKIKSLGLNDTGQLGDNSITNRTSPVLIGGNAKTFCKIDVGGSYTLSLDKNGRAWGWGINGSGQIGDNTSISKRTPVSVLGTAKTFCKISAGFNHSLGIQQNGRVWGWGSNNSGEVGDNSVTNRSTPVSISGATKTFCHISAGSGFSLGIDKNGRAWGWGVNTAGVLGNNSILSQRTPVSVLGAIKTFCKISAGSTHSNAIDKNGRAWGWGLNTLGQIGDASNVSKITPVSVAGAVKTFCEISSNNAYTLAIAKNGRAWGWGNNGNGQLGIGTITAVNTPASIVGATKTFCKIYGEVNGSGLSYGVTNNGSVWGWGYSLWGELGQSIENTKTPVSVKGTTKTFCQISMTLHGLSIDKNGKIWGWGFNSNGQLGDNSIISKKTPITIGGANKTFCKITNGNAFSLAIDKNGRAWSWGINTNNQLGDNSVVSKITPVSVLGGVKTFCEISAGQTFSLAIDKNGRAWGWGANSTGQLGDNSITQRATPVSISGATKTFCKITAGSSYTLAIDKNGRVWGWGNNPNGQLGDNSITSRRTPVSISGATKTFCSIIADAGSSHSLAIDKNGRLWAWGLNNSGCLGDNSVTSRRTPVLVLGAVKTFCKISVGTDFSAAIDKNGRIWSWGLNTYGQLGHNSITSRQTPVSVLGTNKTFCHIEAGNSNCVAIDKNGRVWAWGFYQRGQCGNNQDTTTPIQITFL